MPVGLAAGLSGVVPVLVVCCLLALAVFRSAVCGAVLVLLCCLAWCAVSPPCLLWWPVAVDFAGMAVASCMGCGGTIGGIVNRLGIDLIPCA